MKNVLAVESQVNTQKQIIDKLSVNCVQKLCKKQDITAKNIISKKETFQSSARL